jgi:glycosyltransferase involved in cell wall biosynthesis
MKTIVLMPVKNEDWIIESTLKNTSPFVDHIIVADQRSTDSTIEICKKFNNVEIIQNPYEGHSNMVRWLLLEEARKYGNGNLIICIDADEMISPNAITEMKNLVNNRHAPPGFIFKFKWIQLWKDASHYLDVGVWKNNFKYIAFVDNAGINEYPKEVVVNDHTTRVPDSQVAGSMNVSLPLLHFNFVAWKRNQIKQAWYRCTELIAGKRNAKRINNTYSVTSPSLKNEGLPIETRWIEGLDLPKNLQIVSSEKHSKELLEYFDKYGITFFEPLQIWDISELHNEFVKRVGREPVAQTYPKWLVMLNDIKNNIRNFRLK